MEESRSRALPASPGKPPAPKRPRQQRTVYRKDQLEALDDFFRKNQYPSYLERLALARRLRLQENQVQVWFKNHRAKVAKLFKKQERGGDQRAGAAEPLGPVGVHPALERPRCPEVLTSCNQGAATYDPTFSGPASTFSAPASTFRGPTFSEAQDFYNPGALTSHSFPYSEYPNFCNSRFANFSQEPLLGPSKSFSGDLLGTSVSYFQENSHYYSEAQACGGLQEELWVSPSAAPVPPPALPVTHGPTYLSESESFIPDFTEVFESSRVYPQDPSSSSSSFVSGYQEESDPVGEDSQVSQLLEL